MVGDGLISESVICVLTNVKSRLKHNAARVAGFLHRLPLQPAFRARRWSGTEDEMKFPVLAILALAPFTLPTPASAEPYIARETIKASNGQRVEYRHNEFTGEQSFEIGPVIENGGAYSWSVTCSANPQFQAPSQVSGCTPISYTRTLTEDFRSQFSKATARGNVDIAFVGPMPRLADCRSGCRYFHHFSFQVSDDFRAKTINPKGDRLEVMMTGSAYDRLIDIPVRQLDAMREVVALKVGDNG